MTLPSDVEKRISAAHLVVLRSALADYHAKNGTTQPPVEAISVIDSYPMSATVHVNGDGYQMIMILNVRGGGVEGNGIERLVRNAEKEYRWRYERSASEKASDKQIDAVLARIGGQLVEKKETYISDSQGQIVIVYYLKTTVIGGAMQTLSIDITISNRVADDIWWSNISTTVGAGYKRNARRLAQTAPLMVCPALARWMRTHPERNECAKKLFGAANGGKGTKIPWRNLTNLEARNGCIIGTLGYAGDLRMRGGELILKNKKLPEIVVAAMRGRKVNEVFEHALFGDMTIGRARNTSAGLVIVIDEPLVPYETLWQELNP